MSQNQDALNKAFEVRYFIEAVRRGEKFDRGEKQGEVKEALSNIDAIIDSLEKT